MPVSMWSLTLLAILAALMAGAGLLQAVVGAALVWRFRRRALTVPATLPPVTILKPLFGAEPLLEQALASLCEQDYPQFQIVLGVQDPADLAIGVVARLRARYPACDLVLCIDPTPHGRNRKVANLINMFPAARHDVLVIADSDVHAAPDYLTRLVAALQEPGVGLATTLYAGIAASGSVAGTLGATGITHGFLPGALTARAIGRQDCLGATMALTRATLAAIGGLAALAPHLADDHVLGELVRARGLRVALAATVPATTVPEVEVGALFRHELRWARTIRALAPVGFALSAVQHPLAWATLAVLLTAGSTWSCLLLLGGWATRAALARIVDRLLGLGRGRAGLASPSPIWLLPLRDLLSVAVLVTAYAGDEVEWRGHVLRTRLTPPRLAATGLTSIDPLPLGTEQP